ncbi:MAG: NAD(P)-dependent glycerol-3-phosphate dehydrogenase [Ruminococcaceae bacterium]|nr:NAD(P)-dependent glycerol-3-phosphate dehydrogenase [Oscillospiraceae bacterium]
MKTAVIGSGAWGTALALLLHQNGNSVTLWSYTEAESRTLSENLENPFLPNVPLPKEFEYTSNIECIKDKDLIVFATPSFAIRQTAKNAAPYISENTVIVSVTKGIEFDTGMCMSEIVEQETGRTVVALSGPSHAEEVSRGIPTGVVAACSDKKAAEIVHDAFISERFRVYLSPDVKGVELGAALKNIIALCAGISDGMGYGDNTKALLMTRGLEETARLGLALGASRETFAGLSGIGDLIVTCTSMHSRNRRAGILIGKGMKTDEAMKQIGAVVEGYYAIASALKLAEKVNVEMPITKAAYELIYNGAEPTGVIMGLMNRTNTSENNLTVWR